LQPNEGQQQAHANHLRRVAKVQRQQGRGSRTSLGCSHHPSLNSIINIGHGKMQDVLDGD
jgi:hypothetical protein